MIFFRRKLSRILATGLFVGYIGFSVVGVLHMMHMAEMNMPMTDCPFVHLQETLCTMSASDHFKEFTNTALFTALPLFGIFFTASFFVVYVSLALVKQKQYIFIIKKRCVTRLNQTLFSQGILHTKAF